MALKSVASGVFAESHGSWPPRVVALHGWSRRGSDFDAVLAGLDAIALDLPGFGASPAPIEPYGARGYAELLAPVVGSLPEAPVLVGHSFGGRVAVCLATALPVRGLVLTGVPLIRRESGRSPSFGFRMFRMANRIGIISDDRMERERRSRGSDDYRAATGVMRDVLVAAINESYEDELSMISAPVSMIWGAEDREVPPSVADDARILLESGGTPVRMTTLDGVGHLVPTQAPSQLRSVIDEILQR